MWLLMEKYWLFYSQTFFFFLVCHQWQLVSTRHSQLVALCSSTSLKLSAAVFPTLKLQNSKVISCCHHVDQLVEENRKGGKSTCRWPPRHKIVWQVSEVTHQFSAAKCQLVSFYNILLVDHGSVMSKDYHESKTTSQYCTLSHPPWITNTAMCI